MSHTHSVKMTHVDGPNEWDHEVVILSDNGAYSYNLAMLPDALVLKDTTDGTTAWKIKVSKTGVLTTEQVTAA